MRIPIQGFEDKYTISSNGEVYSLISNKVLKNYNDTAGYPLAKLFISYDATTKKRRYAYIRVHRIAAARALGITQGNIANVIAGRTKTCGGFKWELA